MDIAPNATVTSRLYLCVCHAVPALLSAPHTDHTTCAPGSSLMEVASLQHLGDSGWLKHGVQAPSLERLVDADFGGGLGHSFGSSRSFIDMDPADLFSMRWATTTAPESDFDFGLPIGGGIGSGPPSPLLVSASQIIRNGRLLPCKPHDRPGVREHGGDPDDDTVLRRAIVDAPSAPRTSSPLYHSAQSTPASMSSCSSTRSIAAGERNANKQQPSSAGRRGGRSPSWKTLLRYLRFLVPLYRKVRALRRFSAPRPMVAPASPARASTSRSGVEWCHGNPDAAVRDAILYCKKSSGQGVLPGDCRNPSHARA